jgi:hypothetical protein
MTPFSDLLNVGPAGKLQLQPGIHSLDNLLEMEPEEILSWFKESQRRDFEETIRRMTDEGHPLKQALGFDRLGSDLQGIPVELVSGERLDALFRDLHDHVMGHPVWRHPFFLRIFRGEFDLPQARGFALQYFNQVKNTRQCVALACGRFSSTQPRHFGMLSERVSEVTQIVLAQLLADEYGVGTAAVDDYPDLAGIFSSTTHIVMYRWIFDGLGVPFDQQDQPFIGEVADNIAIQRLVAGNEEFTLLEALSSVGLGMEWGVPEFFTLLLGGLIRFAQRENIPLSRKHLFVLIAHVQYDVMHAIAVMMVTALYATDDEAVRRIKNAVNMLMTGRYAMMSGLYRHIFDEPCPGPDQAGLAEQYHVTDPRIRDALIGARRRIDPNTIVNGQAYRDSTATPFDGWISS